MPEIRPFRGLMYDQSQVPLESVVAPPYDVISPEQQAKLYARHPRNVVRLILGREEDRYTSAAAHLRDWMEAGALIRDGGEAIYLLHQTFLGQGGKKMTRKGFIALCRVDDFSARTVLPHEKTLSKPREDRYRLFLATHANFSQIFSLYWDPKREVDSLLSGIARTGPTAAVRFEDVDNALWRVEDGATVRAVCDFMRDQQVLIADGHHRYETAIAYRDEMKRQNPAHTGDEAYNFVMMYFSNIEDDGLTIFPTHRVVHSLPSFDGPAFLKALGRSFVVRECPSLAALETGLASAASRTFGFVFAGDPKFYLASLRPNTMATSLVTDDTAAEVKELDVTLLHSAILRDMLGISTDAQEKKLNLDYVRDARQAVDAVRNGSAQLCCLMSATRLEEVRAVARAGHVMPQKSTYFYPKLVSGLVVNIMRNGAEG